jgi:hypothetical protein
LKWVTSFSEELEPEIADKNWYLGGEPLRLSLWSMQW